MGATATDHAASDQAAAGPGEPARTDTPATDPPTEAVAAALADLRQSAAALDALDLGAAEPAPFDPRWNRDPGTARGDGQ
ncbi:MAG: hypothetical protein AVDCRST_MAG49-3567 [uncultured Thermomicrobiales bacterium]|uniref:Uncharacterized protein n=1 Tax=uncultured Thermomicrobiales bacterium TaxID=1645740 RepID=A0A6J4V766_9BACT|nr:MAG: hypothetical protein AVDCRST_MAG49-3567 [uncultured Thermomicrobiales bacterium]